MNNLLIKEKHLQNSIRQKAELALECFLGPGKSFRGGYEKVADDSNPIKQARRNAAALKEFLDPDFNRNKEHAFVEPIVVWANPEIKVYRKKPAEPQDPHSQETKCWRIEDLSFELDSIRCKKHLSEKAQREIIKKLESCY